MDEKRRKKMNIAREEELGFGSLNLDVMELVFNHLNDSLTRIRFSAVCRLWRWVAQRCCLMARPQFPWFMLSNDWKSKSDRRFFNLSDGMIHTLHLPEAQGLRCCGSFEGWLVMHSGPLDKKRLVFIIDPLSKAKIHLPDTVINDSVDPQIVPMPHIYRVHLSSAPISNDGANNNNCFVVAVDRLHNLYLCRLGDRSWTRQHFNGLEHFDYDEIIFYNGSFIAIECCSLRINILELVLESNHRLKLRAERHFLPAPVFGKHRVDCDEVIKSLIEWCGELYLIIYEMKSYGRRGRVTTAFHVFKLDSRWNLVKVRNIGDAVIFLVNHFPRCFSVKDFPSLNLKTSCIYYKDFAKGPPYTTNVFSLEDGKWESCPSLSFQEDPWVWYFQEDPWVWYTPKIRY